MEIALNSNWYGIYVEVKTDDVDISYSIDERIYAKDADGKTDYNKPPMRDVDTKTISQFTELLNRMIELRKREFHSVELIKALFEKLPHDTVRPLLDDLNHDYGDSE